MGQLLSRWLRWVFAVGRTLSGECVCVFFPPRGLLERSEVLRGLLMRDPQRDERGDRGMCGPLSGRAALRDDAGPGR